MKARLRQYLGIITLYRMIESLIDRQVSLEEEMTHLRKYKANNAQIGIWKARVKRMEKQMDGLEKRCGQMISIDRQRTIEDVNKLLKEHEKNLDR